MSQQFSKMATSYRRRIRAAAASCQARGAQGHRPRARQTKKEASLGRQAKKAAAGASTELKCIGDQSKWDALNSEGCAALLKMQHHLFGKQLDVIRNHAHREPCGPIDNPKLSNGASAIAELMSLTASSGVTTFIRFRRFRSSMLSRCCQNLVSVP